MTETGRQREAIVAAVEAVADRLQAERTYLTELDSAIGDADHGGNMARGFESAREQVQEMDDAPVDEIVKTVGTALISEVGGASGPLYGGSIMAASQEFDDGITVESAVAAFEAYLEKVESRGDARPGDKTMVDALTPAVHTFKKSIELDELPPLEALAKAVAAAERGVDATVPIRASKGRASYLGWRSVGHQDPGATSTLFILEEILDTASEYCEGETDLDATSPTIPGDTAEDE